MLEQGLQRGKRAATNSLGWGLDTLSSGSWWRQAVLLVAGASASAVPSVSTCEKEGRRTLEKAFGTGPPHFEPDA